MAAADPHPRVLVKTGQNRRTELLFGATRCYNPHQPSVRLSAHVSTCSSGGTCADQMNLEEPMKITEIRIRSLNAPRPELKTKPRRQPWRQGSSRSQPILSGQERLSHTTLYPVHFKPTPHQPHAISQPHHRTSCWLLFDLVFSCVIWFQS